MIPICPGCCHGDLSQLAVVLGFVPILQLECDYKSYTLLVVCMSLIKSCIYM